MKPNTTDETKILTSDEMDWVPEQQRPWAIAFIASLAQTIRGTTLPNRHSSGATCGLEEWLRIESREIREIQMNSNKRFYSPI